MFLPNGCYTIRLQGDQFTVKVSCPSKKRWTRLYIWAGEWFEITNPDRKKVILAKLRDPNTNLASASLLYSHVHHCCGICGNALQDGQEIGSCWDKTFGKDRVSG